MDGWLKLEFFYDTQWRLAVPCFQRSEDDTVQHYNLPPQTVLPWCRITAADGDEILKSEGGYGTVERVRIDPFRHGFTTFLMKLSLPDRYFAVKSTRAHDHEHFENEVDMLKLLGRTAHPHLINVLATFSWKGIDHILLPWADCDLWRFWKTHDGPLTAASKTPRDDMLWISKQIVGLVSDSLFSLLFTTRAVHTEMTG